MKKLLANVKRDSLIAFVISTLTFALFWLGLWQWTEWLQGKESLMQDTKNNETDLGSENITK